MVTTFRRRPGDLGRCTADIENGAWPLEIIFRARRRPVASKELTEKRGREWIQSTPGPFSLAYGRAVAVLPTPPTHGQRIPTHGRRAPSSRRQPPPWRTDGAGGGTRMGSTRIGSTTMGSTTGTIGSTTTGATRTTGSTRTTGFTTMGSTTMGSTGRGGWAPRRGQRAGTGAGKDHRPDTNAPRPRAITTAERNMFRTPLQRG